MNVLLFVEGGICAIGFREDGRPCAETQINRREDHFIVPPVPPSPKSRGQCPPSHPAVAPPMVERQEEHPACKN